MTRADLIKQLADDVCQMDGWFLDELSYADVTEFVKAVMRAVETSGMVVVPREASLSAKLVGAKALLDFEAENPARARAELAGFVYSEMVERMISAALGEKQP